MTYAQHLPTPENLEVEESEIPRDYVDLPPNLAKNDKLVDEYHKSALMFFRKFEGQDLRDKYEEDIREADAMYTMTQRAQATVKGSEQRDNALSNVPSPLFYIGVRTVFAQQSSIIFHGREDDDPPAKFEPVETDDYPEEELERVAEGYNLLFRNDYDKAGYDAIFKKQLFYATKYSKQLCGIEWVYETTKRPMRVPGYYNSKGEPVEWDKAKPPKIGTAYTRGGAKKGEKIEGLPINQDGETNSIVDPDTGMFLSYATVEKEVVKKNCPMPVWVPPHNWWADMDICDLDLAHCLIIRDQKPYSWLVDQARAGLFENVEKITDGCLYRGEDAWAISDIGQEKADNREDSAEFVANGNYDIVKVLLRAPIDDGRFRRGGKTDKTRGEWDKSIPAEWCEATFVGQWTNWRPGAEVPDAVCVQLRKLPYNDKRINYWFTFTHEDDGGGVARFGYSNIAAPAYEENRKNRNQLNDDVDLLIKRPFVVEKGAVPDRRSLPFKQANHVITMNPGSRPMKDRLHQLDIGDATHILIPKIQRDEEDFRVAFGIDKPLTGEFAGARTTGTEVIENKAEGMKPMFSSTRFIGMQLFEPFMQRYQPYYEQFADPEKPIPVRVGKVIRRVVPGELYNVDMRVKIETIDKYEQEISARQAYANFLNTNIAMEALKLMGPEEQVDFYTQTMQAFSIRNASRLFPRNGFKEAEDRAVQDAILIVNDPEAAIAALVTGQAETADGQVVQGPEEGERHDVYIRVVGDKRKVYELSIPKEEQDPRVIQAFDLYIQKREQMAGEQASQAAGAKQNQAPVAPDMAGEAAGDALGAPGGRTI